MPIQPSDIQYRLSGGSFNSSPAASLGGVKSGTPASSDIFDDVSASESAAGSVEYRCIYVHNNHGSLALSNAVAWVPSNTPSPSTAIEIGLGTSAANGAEQTIANEKVAPSGIMFVAGVNKADGVALGDIPAGQHRAIWLRRTVDAGASAALDGFTVRVEGGTDP